MISGGANVVHPELGSAGVELLPPRQEDGFLDRPDLNALLGDSAHHVRVQEDDTGGLWVVKPTTRSKALNERDMFVRLYHEGVPAIPFPAGQKPYVDTQDSGDSVLIMPYVEGLQPLTRQNWQGYPGAPEFEERNQVVRSLFGLAAKMHLRGFAHGDLQIKNIGSLSSGKLVVYDLERTVETRHTGANEAAQLQADDLVSISKSLLINRFLERLDPALQLNIFEDHMQFYVEKRKPANFDAAFLAANIALEDIRATLNDSGWLPKARARFLASRTKMD